MMQAISHSRSGALRVIAALRPFSTEVRELQVSAGGSLSDMLAEIGLKHSLARSAHVFVDDVLYPPETWDRTKPKAGRVITVRVVPGMGGGGGKSPLRIILSIAVIAASVAFGAWLGPLAAGAAGFTGANSTIFGVAASQVFGGIISGATPLIGTISINSPTAPR